VNQRTWGSLYQQKPTAQEGTFFKREWFRRYRVAPAKLHKYITSDHAPSGTEENDWTCVRVWGVDPLGDLYLLDGFRHQETLDKTAEKIVGDKAQGILGLIRKHRPFCWFPEDDNNWKSAAGFIKKMMRAEGNFCRIEPISPHGNDKPTKAQPFQGMAAGGQVWLPEGPEGDEILSQYLKFPGGKNDDEVDTAAIMGRALGDAHPAIADAKAQEPVKVDRWAKAFGDHEDTESWKTA
jgi:predicted phage terminase large subunit-like protein